LDCCCWPIDQSSNDILICQVEDGSAVTEVRLTADTLWMTQAQIAELFGTKRPAITKHLSNIFKSAELEKSSVCSILERTAADNKSYKTQYYNLDAILTVGYRVNSINATRFRQWANGVLKGYLTRGYALNEKWLKEQQVKMSDLRICSVSSSRSMPSATAINALPPPFFSASWLVTEFSIGMNKSPIQKLYFSGKDVCRPRCCTMGSKSRSE